MKKRVQQSLLSQIDDEDRKEPQTWQEHFLDLRHPNYYIAFLKGVLWGTAAYITVAGTAAMASAAAAFLIRFFLPESNSFLLLMVDGFGHVSTAVSFSSLIVVMVTETWTLVNKIRES